MEKSKDDLVEVKRRPRTGRAIAQRVSKSVPTAENLITADDDAVLKSLMVKCAEHNEQMNLHKKAYELAREDLYKRLSGFNKRSYTFNEATVNGRECALDATLETPSSRVIDIAKLKKAVTAEVFLRCVSATVGAVQEHAGVNIVTQCAEAKSGNENVTVKARAR